MFAVQAQIHSLAVNPMDDLNPTEAQSSSTSMNTPASMASVSTAASLSPPEEDSVVSFPVKSFYAKCNQSSNVSSTVKSRDKRARQIKRPSRYE